MTGSKWLDRLHQLKGFPVSDDFCLDHFLSHQNSFIQNPSFIEEILPNPNCSEHVLQEPDKVQKCPNSNEKVQKNLHCSEKVPKTSNSNSNVLFFCEENHSLIEKVKKSPIFCEKIPKKPNSLETVPEKLNSIEKVETSANSNEKVEKNTNCCEKVPENPNSTEKVQKSLNSNEKFQKNINCCEKVSKNLNSNENVEKNSSCCDKVPKNPNLNEKVQKILFDLFNFGKSDNDSLFNPQKGTRKQKKPKFRASSNMSKVMEKRVEKEVFKRKGGDIEERGSSDLIGYWKTDITVIDTSYPKWKCERVVFRKKNLWRVRDRNYCDFGSKKRKHPNLADHNRNPITNISKSLPSSKGNKQTEKMNKNSEEPRDTLNQVPNQRFPRKLKKGGYNGLLTKRTTSTKIG